MYTIPEDHKPETFMQGKNEEKLNLQIDEYDNRMINYLARLYKGMTGNYMDFETIGDSVAALQQFNSASEYTYLKNLLHPEKQKGVKIPSPIPVPSCAFQMHNSLNLSTNSSGNLAILFNPFFLYDMNGLNAMPYQGDSSFVPDYFSTFYINNANSLNGSDMPTGTYDWHPINIGQGIPNVYDQYRLVSASIVVKYIGRIDITSGVIGGAIVFDENRTVGTYGKWNSGSNQYSNSSFANKYSNFDLAMDSFYHQENLSLEGIRELYFPIDNSFEEYTKLFTSDLGTAAVIGGGQNVLAEEQYMKSGFNYMIYILGAPPSSSSFKVDIYCNFECLPNAAFLNYMPISLNPYTIPQSEKQYSINVAQQNSIQKANSPYTFSQAIPNIWKKMKEKFGNAMPNIATLIAKGAINMIPALKPLMGIAGTILDSTRMITDS